MAWSEWNAHSEQSISVWRFHAVWLSCKIKPNKQKAMSMILSDVVYCICFNWFENIHYNFCILYFSCTKDCRNSTQDCKCRYEALPISHQEYNSQYAPVVVVLYSLYYIKDLYQLVLLSIQSAFLMCISTI
jgi:hypothetical protein